MSTATRSILKPFDFSAFSAFTLEDILSVDALPADGRANVLSTQYQRPGGMCFFGLHAVRSFDSGARLALGGLGGGRDVELARAAVGSLDANTQALWSIEGKFTNRSEVILGPATRLILLHTRDIDWQTDLDWPACRRMLGVIARSRASLIGNLPVEFTRLAIDFGRKVGTYVGLVAGAQQFGQLRVLQPDLLVLNCAEAGSATGANTTDPDGVFERLVALSPARTVMMTDGANATHVLDRSSGRQYRFRPPRLVGRLFTLGAGDAFAGSVTFLLGQAGAAAPGEAMGEVVRFAHEVAAAHLTDDPVRKAQVRACYHDVVRSLFELSESTPEPAGIESEEDRRTA